MVMGSLIHIIYRTVIFDFGVKYLHDLWRSDTYRRYLWRRRRTSKRSAWTPLDSARAQRLYILLTLSASVTPIDYVLIRRSSIHFCYQAGLFAFLFAIVSAIAEDLIIVLCFSVISVVFLIVATFLDIQEEDEEYIMLLSKISSVEKAANELGLALHPEPGPHFVSRSL